ncbi:MAG TPA: class I SAM-dependent methyltransferase, partial [Planctomycetota bacterium]|nr:class I SAM-dependent methyltransferase [Planctomycetota bacterium]
ARSLTIADIGAGTGISSRQLADRGARVLAIEPNVAMRKAAAPHAGVTFVDGAAEKTTLPNASVDLVTAFQAFHWFEPNAALAEFHRILRLHGRFAVTWNERDARDPFTAEYGKLILEASGDHPLLKRSGVSIAGESVRASLLFKHPRELIFPNSKRMTCEGLLGASLSASYIPQSGPAHEKLMDDLKALHAEFSDASGCVEMIYRTEILLADRA